MKRNTCRVAVGFIAALFLSPFSAQAQITTGTVTGRVVDSTGGVIANAVTSALRSFGVQINTLPLTPPCIWELVQRSIASRSASA